MSNVRTHRDLNVWKESMNLVKQVYSLTQSFPKEEIYGLVSQMRRAAVSIPSNIAEGSARSPSTDFARFLYVAMGSLAELETQLLLSRELGFTQNIEMDENIDQIKRMLIGLIKSLRKRG